MKSIVKKWKSLKKWQKVLFVVFLLILFIAIGAEDEKNIDKSNVTTEKKNNTVSSKEANTTENPSKTYVYNFIREDEQMTLPEASRRGIDDFKDVKA